MATQTMSGQWNNYPLAEANGNGRTSSSRQASQERGQNKRVKRVPSGAAWNIMSDSEETKVRRQSLKRVNSRKRSQNTMREKKVAADPVDDSAWIHRDKLAEIEIKEMQEAGIVVWPSRRSVSAGPGASQRSSRSQSRSRRPSKDQGIENATEEEYREAYPGYEDHERKRVSTIPAAGEEEQFDPTFDTEFRTPEEVHAERASVRSNSIIRPSTSRIPVSKASPVPVSHTVVGRESPLPRSRGNSNGGIGSWDEMQYARRARSTSIGSQAILVDELDGVRTPSRPGSSNVRWSNENSPSKARVPKQFAPTSGARKGSLPNSVQPSGSTSSNNRARIVSTNSNRPTSRSGHKSRPSTSHQQPPEGDAPWIAGMYKPDPRLPPDQQMLPTHAKRMMQEQWEKEGKTGTAYDRDLRLLNDTEISPPPNRVAKPLPTSPAETKPPQLDFSNPPQRQPSPTRRSPNHANSGTSPNNTDMTAWPLAHKNSDRSADNASLRPGTSGGGGYRITPTISTPPAIEKSPTPSFTNQMAPPHNATPRIPDFDEKEEVQEKKKTCGCCIVM
ncbi:hypothetical protein LTR37_015470 [Vermiconidia calcicola]|uniref:Uncharacterized protein n=1 Tax=Vermiconidia calcicola TaxID=1690605 RepID=A0ACC3MQQ8_9PEZI|nr:hypothetical protein LTR37_015470 [Vermiconidia calcicola]